MIEIVRPFAQRVADDAVGLVLADLGTQRAQLQLLTSSTE